MQEEIKEILDDLLFTTTLPNVSVKLSEEKLNQLKDYITNLQEENEYFNYCDEEKRKTITNLRYKIERLEEKNERLKEELEELREDNYAYHQLMKMQNEREYRSKFLKEFQEEFGKNIFPDYDEIYKRYDKLKKENERLKKENSNLLNTNYWLNSRIDNAIEYNKKNIHSQTLDNILQGVDKE